MNESSIQPLSPPHVMRLADVALSAVKDLLARYRIKVKLVEADKDIPGSFWGDEEAGLVGNCVIVRTDTPLHSLLHEGCHYICMDKERRDGLDTDAGGDYDEENAVCYLQILLADHIDSFGRDKAFEDMDAWGYTFRLGSARAWFEQDAEDALRWLQSHGLVDESGQPTWALRDH